MFRFEKNLTYEFNYELQKVINFFVTFYLLGIDDSTMLLCL